MFLVTVLESPSANRRSMARELTPSLGDVTAGSWGAAGAGAGSEQATVATASKTIAAVAIKDINLQHLCLYVFMPKYYNSGTQTAIARADSRYCVIYASDVLLL
jgi:hypothetical protein